MLWSGRILVLAVAGSTVALTGCDRSRPPGNATPLDSAHSVAQRTNTSKPAAEPAAGTTDAKLPAPGKAPEHIRGIYLNAYAAGSKARFAKLIAIADSTEINAFVIDVKDEKGVHYPTRIALAKQLAQPGEITLASPAALVDTLHAHGIYAIARIVVFKDPILSKAKPEWSIKTQSGSLWHDKAGNTWVSAWDPNVWEYNIQIAEEVLKAGFDEVQFDYVRFPEPFPSLPKQVHAQARGDRTAAIVAFLDQARPRVHALGGIMAADVFGLSPNDPKDVNIGQQWERILAAADHVLPMVYPSHYLPTHLRGVPNPNRMPYETVFNSVGIGVMRVEKLKQAGTRPARVIPWLQAFSAPWVSKDYPYGPEQAAAQIRGVYDTGLNDWIFWHPGAKYEQVMSAFARTTAPSARKFTPSPVMTETIAVLERTGVAEQRKLIVQ
ncbi:MAG TPA: putative glycoside hydrolase [Longimicrobiales bacterium]|nr:putative glycoside hydrolase [Longimicrobiales bacterium]